MSRIGNQKIKLPNGVTVAHVDQTAVITGPKGELVVAIPQEITVINENNELTVARKNETKRVKALHGLIRSLLANAITGVSEGFEKRLELHGVGFRAALEGQNLALNLGFSHPVSVTPPEGIQFKVEKNVVIVSGIDKQLVGQVSANIREYRRPEPYKGKGIRYSDEIVRRKPGKAAKGATS